MQQMEHGVLKQLAQKQAVLMSVRCQCGSGGLRLAQLVIYPMSLHGGYGGITFTQCTARCP